MNSFKFGIMAIFFISILGCSHKEHSPVRGFASAEQREILSCNNDTDAPPIRAIIDYRNGNLIISWGSESHFVFGRSREDKHSYTFDRNVIKLNAMSANGKNFIEIKTESSSQIIKAQLEAVDSDAELKKLGIDGIYNCEVIW